MKLRFTKATLAVTAVAVGVGAFGFGTLASASTPPPAPTVTKLSVTKGSSAGNTVTVITGTNFNNVSKVEFGTKSAQAFLVVSPTQIVAQSPTTGLVGGTTVDVLVTVGTTPSATNTPNAADKFSVITPIDGDVAAGTLLNPMGGSAITVTSTGNFGIDAAAFKLLKVTATVGGKTAAVTYVNKDSVKVAAPAGTPSATGVDVVIYTDTVPGAVDSDATYAAVITGLSKTSGPVGGGSTITITGKGLTGATAWKFGANNGISCAYVSAAKADTSWTCQVPPGTAGPVSVSFTPATSGTPAVGASYGTLAGATYTYSDVS